MAGPGATTPNPPTPLRPLPRPPGHDFHSPKHPKIRTPHHHVSSFSPRQHSPLSPYSPKLIKNPSKSSCSNCCNCFQYTCLVFLGILFLVLLFLALFIILFYSALPEIKIERLTIPSLKLSSVDLQSYLSANVNIFIDSLNKNKKTWISFGDMKVSISSGNIELGQATIPGFLQSPKNLTVLKADTKITNSMVDNGDGANVKAGFQDKSLALQVMLTGKIGLIHGSLKFKGFLVVIKCSNVRLSSILRGFEPVCGHSIFTLGSVF